MLSPPPHSCSETIPDPTLQLRRSLVVHVAGRGPRLSISHPGTAYFNKSQWSQQPTFPVSLTTLSTADLPRWSPQIDSEAPLAHEVVERRCRQERACRALKETDIAKICRMETFLHGRGKKIRAKNRIGCKWLWQKRWRSYGFIHSVTKKKHFRILTHGSPNEAIVYRIQSGLIKRFPITLIPTTCTSIRYNWAL